MIHGAPALVLAQHLGRNLRFKGSPVCDRPHSASADTNAFLDRLLRDMRVRFSDSEQWSSLNKLHVCAQGVLPRNRGKAQYLRDRKPTPSLCFCDPGATRLRPGPGGHSAVKPAAPLTRHHPHDTRRSGSSLGAAPWSKFALQRQPSVRQAALEQLPTPMSFTTGSFRACASGSRTANNGVHQLSLRARKIVLSLLNASRPNRVPIEKADTF